MICRACFCSTGHFKASIDIYQKLKHQTKYVYVSVLPSLSAVYVSYAQCMLLRRPSSNSIDSFVETGIQSLIISPALRLTAVP